MKHVAIDMDGVLCEYYHKKGSMNTTNFDIEGFFYERKPLNIVINAIKALFKDRHLFILSASPTEMAIKEKNAWLDEYFPIEERYFINFPDGCKAQFLIDYAEKHNIPRNEILLIDDNHEILRKVEKAGFKVMHISRLITLYEREV